MKIHKRLMLVNLASAEIGLAIAKKVEEHDLTNLEVIEILTSTIQSYLKYELRMERHGNYDKPAGQE